MGFGNHLDLQGSPCPFARIMLIDLHLGLAGVAQTAKGMFIQELLKMLAGLAKSQWPLLASGRLG